MMDLQDERASKVLVKVRRALVGLKGGRREGVIQTERSDEK